MSKAKRHYITDGEYLSLIKLRDTGAPYEMLRQSRRGGGKYGSTFIAGFPSLYNILRGIDDVNLKCNRILDLYSSGKISGRTMSFGIKFAKGEIIMEKDDVEENTQPDNTAIFLKKMLDYASRIAKASEQCATRIDRIDDRLATITRRIDLIEQTMRQGR